MIRAVLLLCLLSASGAILDAAPPRTAPVEAGVASQNPTVPVELIVRHGQFREGFLQQIRQEAEALWQKSGVTLVWRGGSPSACDPPLRVWLSRTPGRSVAGDTAMGSILFDHGVPLPVIHLSVENVEALLRFIPLTDTSPAIHDLQVARALGRTLAHEIGHYVLSRETHEREGLMRATWPIQEAVAAGRRTFELLPEQRAAAIERLAAQQVACVAQTSLMAGSSTRLCMAARISRVALAVATASIGPRRLYRTLCATAA